MNEILVKILGELLSTLALATKQMREGDPSESVFGRRYYITRCNATAEKLYKDLLEDKDVEAVLQQLDQLTRDEARITAATLEVVYGLIQNMRVVMDGKQTC